MGFRTQPRALDYEEYWEARGAFWERHRTEERNRKAPPGFDPMEDDGWVDDYGVYFAIPNPHKNGTEEAK